jgi:hypothetical protein
MVGSTGNRHLEFGRKETSAMRSQEWQRRKKWAWIQTSATKRRDELMLLLDCSPSATHLYYLYYLYYSDEKETQHVTPKVTKKQQPYRLTVMMNHQINLSFGLCNFLEGRIFTSEYLKSEFVITESQFFLNAFIGVFARQGISMQVSGCSPVHWLALPMTSRLCNRDTNCTTPRPAVINLSASEFYI